MQEKPTKEVKIVKHIDKHYGGGGSGGAIYGFGVIGAAFYFLPQASGFWEVVIAILKSFAWPAFFVFKALSLLKI